MDLWFNWFYLHQRRWRHAPVWADWSLVCSCNSLHKCGTYQPEKTQNSRIFQELNSILIKFKKSAVEIWHKTSDSHPSDKAVAHILWKLLIVHQLLQKNTWRKNRKKHLSFYNNKTCSNRKTNLTFCWAKTPVSELKRLKDKWRQYNETMYSGNITEASGSYSKRSESKEFLWRTWMVLELSVKLNLRGTQYFKVKKIWAPLWQRLEEKDKHKKLFQADNPAEACHY